MAKFYHHAIAYNLAHLSRTIITLSLLALNLHAGPKRPLLHTDYDGWKTIAPQVLSRDGRYLAYGLFPQDGDGELVVRNLATGTEKRYPAGAVPLAPDTADAENPEAPPLVRSIRIVFSSDNKHVAATTFASKQDKKGKSGLLIIDLTTTAETRIADVASMQVSDNGGPWVAYRKSPKTPAAASPAFSGNDETKDQRRAGGATPGARQETGADLVLRQLDTGVERTFEDVTEYGLAKDAKVLVFAVSSKKDESNGIYAVKPGDDAAPIALLAGKGKYTRPTFDRLEKQLVFLSNHVDGKQFKAYWWNRQASAATELSSAGLAPNYVLADRGQATFSYDCSRLFLPAMTEAALTRAARPATPTVPADDKVLADLWHWKDDYIQPMQKVRAAQERIRTYRAIYHITDHKLVQVADASMPTVQPSDNGKLAIGSDDRKYRSMVDYDGTYADLYLIDTLTNQRTPLIEKFRGNAVWSPKANYALAFKKGDWWSVRVTDGYMTNLTSTLGVKFANELNDLPAEAASYGNAGWTRDGAGVLVYDMYDVWHVSADGKSSRRLTQGREQKLQFRVTSLDGRGGGAAFGPAATLEEDADDERGIDPAKPLYLRAEHQETRDTGIFKLATFNGTPEKLIYGPKAYRLAGKAKNADVVLITASTFNEEPNLHVTDSTFKTLKQVTVANPQKADILWGSGELLWFKNGDGVPLQAALYKPENFDPSKKYPLMVYIYERLSQGVNGFVRPAPGTSVNIAYYVSNGYLVLTPDIVYTLGSPGQSALKCVLPAITEVVSRGFVDEKTIGIQGHSWGGYQIAYMLTRTSRFKAAEAGAPVANMTSAYNGIRWGTGLPRQFQYEKTQSRIGGTLWENPLEFLENSPVFRANRVTTPLLILQNDDDDAVPWYQGIELFLSLRRNGREAYLFDYNGEKHGLRRRHNQKDYTVRMQQFFDHYLKGAAAPEWMEKGISYLEREDEKKALYDAVYGK